MDWRTSHSQRATMRADVMAAENHHLSPVQVAGPFFLTSPDGLLLMSAYMEIKDRDIQRQLLDLVQEVARVLKGPGGPWVN